MKTAMVFYVGVTTLFVGAHLAQAQTSSQPNVLFIISDDLTATALGSYGNTVAVTPNLDALAASGVQFENAYCQYPVCGPSRASMMTGLYPAAIGTTSNGSSDFRSRHPDIITMPQLFRQNGYTAARVSKIYHMGVPGDILNGTSGTDDPMSWDTALNVQGPEGSAPGVSEDLSPWVSPGGADFLRVESTLGGLFHADGMATTQAINLLNQYQGQSEPFFLALGMVRPHVPLVAPASYFDPFPTGDMTLPFVPPGDLDDVPSVAETQTNAVKYGMSEEQQRGAVGAYYASVSYMDAQVGRILDELEQLGMRENTIVVFTSDHGYNLGEHTTWQKLSLFEDTIRTPLIISVPGNESNAGESSDRVVEMVDLYPTLAELAGMTTAILPNGIHGRSFAELLDDPSGPNWDDEAAYAITRYGAESLRTNQWRYNLWQDGSVELYDQINDPNEYANLADDPAYAAIVAALDAQLDAMRTESLTIPDSNYGDLNFDGVINAADWMMLAPNLLTDVSPLNATEAYQHGDMNADGLVDRYDFDLFKGAYEDANGQGSFAEMNATVPEPASWLLALLAILIYTLHIGRRDKQVLRG